ncbi:cupin domain-containing protein [Anaeromicrobium sediminis]|uniref:Cupin n=1 Tax=Anaeromicrobium sediminis TaxID=1478221 RepID=A0A267MFM8_9FIRM|nr:cupin domain-containing protein [Anaeromicrobium sediminis]PAB58379.1 cupin [Anaeromicrobium sediminis]
MEKRKFIKNIPFEEALVMKELVTYEEGRVVSRTLVQRDNLTMTLFAFDKGEGISTHSAPGDAMVYILDGKVEISIGDNPKLLLEAGQTTVMPADIPHGLEAVENFKMLLILVK